MKSFGFTLVELLVAFGIFVLMIGGALALVQSAIHAQAESLKRQAAIEEATFAMEYISRALRGAQEDTDQDCLSVAGPGSTFEVVNSTGNWNYIRFIDRNDRCREFRLFHAANDRRLREQISPDKLASNFGNFSTVISDDFDVIVFYTNIRGESNGDYVQPYVTFALQLGDPPNSLTNRLVGLQTTVTTRTIDVP